MDVEGSRKSPAKGPVSYQNGPPPGSHWAEQLFSGAIVLWALREAFSPRMTRIKANGRREPRRHEGRGETGIAHESSESPRIHELP